MVVPFGDPQYRALRPAIALTESELVKLDERVALHNALEPLHPWFADESLAIVQGVGYPDANRSHFFSTAVWQTAQLDPYRTGEGWLGRSVEAQRVRAPGVARAKPAERTESAATNALDAVGIGSELSPAMYLPRVAVPAMPSLDAFAVRPDPYYPPDLPLVKDALAALYDQQVHGAPDAAFIREVGRTALRASGMLANAAAAYTSTAVYPPTAFGAQLKLAAQLLSGNVGTRLFHLTLGGFDTHANQKGQHRNLLKQFADGVTAFVADLKAHGIDDRVVILTYSEFGRRAQENASAGTDHGNASSVFLIGRSIIGGFHGPTPDLGHLQDGDVPMAIDFRSVYAAVLREWLGIDPVRVLGAPFAGLPLFKSNA
jgi:uncharacterized protein (DUF1501 family)